MRYQFVFYDVCGCRYYQMTYFKLYSKKSEKLNSQKSLGLKPKMNDIPMNS